MVRKNILFKTKFNRSKKKKKRKKEKVILIE